MVARVFNSLFLAATASAAVAFMLHAETISANSFTSDDSAAPWKKPRELSQFQSLLSHSPFSLATAEESSPLSERYLITGMINIDGENEVFVFDKTDQSHTLLTKKANEKGMSLVQVIPQDDPNTLKASIHANGETGVISNIDTSTNANSMQQSRMNGTQQRPPMNHSSQYPTGVNQPINNNSYPPGVPHYQNGQPYNSSSRRVIRRPVISPQQNHQGYPANNPSYQNNQSGNYSQ